MATTISTLNSQTEAQGKLTMQIGSISAIVRSGAVIVAYCTLSTALATAEDNGLVAYWKLKGDCSDYSGHGHDAVNHGVDLKTSSFGGREAYIEAPDAPELHFGAGDFSILAEVYTESAVTDVIGDIVTKFDPRTRIGFN